MSNTWDIRWLKQAKHISQWSKDRSTKVGAVIVDNTNRIVSTGWNGFPRGINDNVDVRHERPIKYKWTEHAERNAIYNAAANGHKLDGCTMYITMFCCVDCARGIIQTGIKRVVSPIPDMSNQVWAEDFKLSKEMLTEANVNILWYDGNSIE